MIGLEQDNSKIEVVSKHSAWCSLCRKRIYQGETVYSWEEYPSYKVHINCVDVKDRVNATFYQREVRKNVKGKRKGTQWK